jgi:hypothetical protein
VPVLLSFSMTPGPTRLKPDEKMWPEVASCTDLLISDTSDAHAPFNLQVPPYFSRNTLHYGPQTHIDLHRVS